MARQPEKTSGARTWATAGALAVILVALVVVFTLADALPRRRRPDELPVVLNKESPFRYPRSLYEQKVQGNVTLRIFIGRDGRVRPESTRVEESSGYASLDSSAVTGSQELRFAPAKLKSEPMAVSILFPVFFRHPEASPLPGDTVLKRQ
jgi:TonB family protein